MVAVVKALEVSLDTVQWIMIYFQIDVIVFIANNRSVSFAKRSKSPPPTHCNHVCIEYNQWQNANQIISLMIFNGELGKYP